MVASTPTSASNARAPALVRRTSPSSRVGGDVRDQRRSQRVRATQPGARPRAAEMATNLALLRREARTARAQAARRRSQQRARPAAKGISWDSRQRSTAREQRRVSPPALRRKLGLQRRYCASCCRRPSAAGSCPEPRAARRVGLVCARAPASRRRGGLRDQPHAGVRASDVGGARVLQVSLSGGSRARPPRNIWADGSGAVANSAKLASSPARCSPRARPSTCRLS
jgi:hypothetical protein